MSQWYTFRSCTARLQIPCIFREFNHFTSIQGKYRYICNFIINGLLYMSALNGNVENNFTCTYNTCVIKKLVVSLYLNYDTSIVLTFGNNSMQPSKFTKRANFFSLISQTNLVSWLSSLPPVLFMRYSSVFDSVTPFRGTVS